MLTAKRNQTFKIMPIAWSYEKQNILKHVNTLEDCTEIKKKGFIKFI